MPPLILRCGFGFTCFLTIITCSTSTRFLSAITRRTRPRLPLSLPAMTSTVSLRLILMPAINTSPALGDLSEPESAFVGRGLRGAKLDNLWRERDDLEELLLSKLTSHRAKDTGSDRLHRIVNNDGGVLVEANVGSILAAILLAGTHDHGLDDLALLDGSVRRSLFDRRGDDIAEAGLLAQTATEGQDHLKLARAGVIGHVKDCSHLY